MAELIFIVLLPILCFIFSKIYKKHKIKKKGLINYKKKLYNSLYFTNLLLQDDMFAYTYKFTVCYDDINLYKLLYSNEEVTIQDFKDYLIASSSEYAFLRSCSDKSELTLLKSSLVDLVNEKKVSISCLQNKGITQNSNNNLGYCYTINLSNNETISLYGDDENIPICRLEAYLRKINIEDRIVSSIPRDTEI